LIFIIFLAWWGDMDGFALLQTSLVFRFFVRFLWAPFPHFKVCLPNFGFDRFACEIAASYLFTKPKKKADTNDFEMLD